jgi:hypothetical protein
MRRIAAILLAIVTTSAAAQLSVSQVAGTSSKPDAPYHVTVTVATAATVSHPHVLVSCSVQPMYVTGGLAGAQQGVMIGRPVPFGNFLYSGTSDFTSAAPLVIEVWAAAPITCSSAKTQ